MGLKNFMKFFLSTSSLKGSVSNREALPTLELITIVPLAIGTKLHTHFFRFL